MALKEVGRKVFSVKGLCCVLGVGYLYILKKYVSLEYYHYKRKRALLEHDAHPTKMNMIMVERYLKEKSQR